MMPLVGDFLPLDASRRAAVVIAARGRDDEIAKAPEMLKGKTEQDALIAYLQNLGTAIKTQR